MNPTTLRPWLPRLAATVVFVGVLLLLRVELGGISVSGVVAALASTRPGPAAVALFLTGVAFGGLVWLEWLSVRAEAGASEGAELDAARVGWAAFLGYAFSQALGSPLLGRAPVRDRLYTSWGMDPERSERAVRAGRSALLLGLPMVLGWALVGLPGVPTPLAESLGGPAAGPLSGLARLVGLGLLVGVAGWAARNGRAAPPRLAASAAYWLASAGALFALLPPQAAPHGFGGFLGIFVLAHAAGLLSRVPAGIGVFEVVLLALLPDGAVAAPTLVAIVAFRVVYDIAPLLVAAATVALSQSGPRRATVGRAFSVIGSGVSAVVPLVLSGAVFLAGAVLLVTGALPLESALLRLPLPLVEVSHFLGSVAGTILLILSWGLARRLDAAFKAAMVLLAVGVVLAALRGGGAAPAAVLLLVLVVLVPARKEFFRPAALTVEPLSPDWLLGVGVVLAATLWLGFFAYRDVTLSGELWWEFALRGDASRFLRASVGAAAVLLAFAGARLLRTPEPEEPEATDLPAETERVVASSPRPNANLVWLGDKRVLLSKGRDAFVMYGVEGRSWISMGDPVGEPADFEDLVWMFRSRTFRHGGWPVFYQATPACLPLYVDAGLHLLKLGEEAVVDAAGFGLEGGARAGMRKAVRKVEKEGISFRVLPPEEVVGALPRLREISDAWLADKGAKEKGFSLGAFSEAYVRHFPVAVALQEDRIVAFGNLWLGGDGGEFSLDLMRYDPGSSPQGVMQYLFAQALLWGKDQGFRRFSLGMAPLSGLEAGPLAPLPARLGAALYRHGEHFYNFQGLRAYKEKFDPAWEPRYLAYPGGWALPRILGNLATLVSGGVRGALGR